MTIADLIDKLQDAGPNLRGSEIELHFPCEVNDVLARFDVEEMWIKEGKVILVGGTLVK